MRSEHDPTGQRALMVKSWLQPCDYRLTTGKSYNSELSLVTCEVDSLVSGRVGKRIQGDPAWKCEECRLRSHEG